MFAVCVVRCVFHTSTGVLFAHKMSICRQLVSKSNPVSTVSIILQLLGSVLRPTLSTGPDGNWPLQESGPESDPTASLACRIQLSHCCLLKASLAWKEWVWSWPPQRNVTRKKFLAKNNNNNNNRENISFTYVDWNNVCIVKNLY